MNTLLPLLLAVLTGQSQSSDIQVIELFRAETPEELEAALIGGYPMPWLAEILADTTIPEEDRYWLDCRMRAEIAQNLHLFYDEKGNLVHYEAEWVAPGESYWRENFMINPPTEDYGWGEGPATMPSYLYGEPGQVVNRYGEIIGELAVVEREIRLSRDATLGVIPSGSADPMFAEYACLLYLDGSFLEVAIGASYYASWCQVSSDGEFSVFCARDPQSEDLYNGHVTGIGSDGSMLFQTELGLPIPISHPTMSPDGRLIAVPLNVSATSPGAVVILDSADGDVLASYSGLSANHLIFSLDGSQLFISCPLGSQLNGLYAVETEGDPSDWRLRQIAPARPRAAPFWVSAGSSDALVSLSVRCDYIDAPIEQLPPPRAMLLSMVSGTVTAPAFPSEYADLSPNGFFCASTNLDLDFLYSEEGPVSVWRIRKEDQR